MTSGDGSAAAEVSAEGQHGGALGGRERVQRLFIAFAYGADEAAWSRVIGSDPGGYGYLGPKIG